MKGISKAVIWIWSVAIVYFLVIRALIGKLFMDYTLMITPLYVLFIYLTVYPYLTGKSMMVPSYSYNLIKGKDDGLRTILFVAGVISTFLISISPKS